MTSPARMFLSAAGLSTATSTTRTPCTPLAMRNSVRPLPSSTLSERPSIDTFAGGAAETTRGGGPAGFPGHPQSFDQIVAHLLHPHADPATPRLAELTQLRHHLTHDVRGNRKCDADRAAAGRIDRRVHAHHTAIHVEQRSARIATID